MVHIKRKILKKKKLCSSITPATLQAFNNHMRLEATTLDSADTNYFYHQRVLLDVVV